MSEENGMVIGAQAEWDRIGERDDQYQLAVETYMDSADWYDIALFLDAPYDLGHILSLLDDDKPDEVRDLMHKWLTDYAEHMASKHRDG